MDRFILVKSFGDPELEAMLQALYSRSHKSIKEHLEELKIPLKEEVTEKHLKIKKSLATYYIGYGHASIGDCASATVFMENVSIIAAKAIQNTPLYNGQESSTRYIDFKCKKDYLFNLIKDIVGQQSTKTFEKDLHEFLDSYYEMYEKVKKFIIDKERDSLPVFEKDNVTVQKAINVYAFDVARGFLPSGTLTQLSFHGTLRNLRSHFKTLRSHYLKEVRDIALEVLKELHEQYPSAFEKELLTEKVKIDSKNKTYIDSNFLYPRFNHSTKTDLKIVNDYLYTVMVDYGGLGEANNQQANLVSMFNYYIPKEYIDALDYGSWRDLQRHRNGFINPVLPELDLSLLEEDKPFLVLNTWYNNILIKNYDGFEGLQLLLDFGKLLKDFVSKYKDILPLPYITPMGVSIDVLMSCKYTELDYILNLRLQETVHGSLVNFLLNLNSGVSSQVAYFLKYNERQYLRNKTYSVKRAKQDIVRNNPDSEKCDVKN